MTKVWLFLLASFAAATLVLVPLTYLLGVTALLAESGGKRSHPFVLPFLVWGTAEVAWTLIQVARSRRKSVANERMKGRLLALGWGSTFLLGPAALWLWDVLATRPEWIGGSEWGLVVPYACATIGSRLTRFAIGIRGTWRTRIFNLALVTLAFALTALWAGKAHQ